MSDLRVALIGEGPTDAVVIEAALRALLPRPFVLTQLQPEATRPDLGAGWGGVLRWCLDFAKRGAQRFEDAPLLPGFDLFVVHADADIAEDSYARVSADVAETAAQKGWPALPNKTQCPPPTGSADAVRACLLSWAGLQAPGPKTVLCVPSKSTDAWLVAAVFEEGHALLTNLECNLNLAAQVAALPKAQRIKKTARDYRTRAKLLTDQWPVVRRRCTQAERFSVDVAAVFP